MQWRQLGTTDLKIAPLVLGGNVFGWTADKDASFAIMDAFLAAGFNAIDTADVYNRYAPGLKGGESETIIGAWMEDRGVRDRVVIITKGGLEMAPGQVGLGREYLPKACEASLKRLRTDYIDVYMSHRPDPRVPIEQTLEVYQKLIDAGKIRYAACSGYNPDELNAALAAAGPGRARYAVNEPQYNLVERCEYEGAMEKICIDQQVGVVSYYALAAGFLTGKYRSTESLGGKARGSSVSKYLTPAGFKVLNALDTVAARRGASPSQVALAWVMARPSVTAPIASATSLEQLTDILKSVDLRLAPEDFTALNVN